LNCSILHTNKFVALETLRSLDCFDIDCKELMVNHGVTELELPLSQLICIELPTLVVVEDACISFKKARIEKSVKRVTFALPEITKGEPTPSSLGIESESDSLPMLTKAQRSVYCFMLTMKMEQQLDNVQ
jgi:hypothetical protein